MILNPDLLETIYDGNHIKYDLKPQITEWLNISKINYYTRHEYKNMKIQNVNDVVNVYQWDLVVTIDFENQSDEILFRLIWL